MWVISDPWSQRSPSVAQRLRGILIAAVCVYTVRTHAHTHTYIHTALMSLVWQDQEELVKTKCSWHHWVPCATSYASENMFAQNWLLSQVTIPKHLIYISKIKFICVMLFLLIVLSLTTIWVLYLFNGFGSERKLCLSEGWCRGVGLHVETLRPAYRSLILGFPNSSVPHCV